jgi:hypothetical protein
MAADSDVNLGIATPKVDYRRVYQLKYTAETSLVDILCAVEPRLL